MTSVSNRLFNAMACATVVLAATQTSIQAAPPSPYSPGYGIGSPATGLGNYGGYMTLGYSPYNGGAYSTGYSPYYGSSYNFGYSPYYSGSYYYPGYAASAVYGYSPYYQAPYYSYTPGLPGNYYMSGYANIYSAPAAPAVVPSSTSFYEGTTNPVTPAFYSENDWRSAPVADSDKTVHLRVTVPDPNADVVIDGAKTTTMGPVRIFRSPSLGDGTYTYEVRATWMQNGTTKTSTKKVNVTAGSWTTVNFAN